ncbi:hypothetical protein [Hymenobacter qilianensis]|uniref:hypothetical protein n=1 Tax=Hymenobacter qilianensis TaxID=1385715 RepID=UPI001CB91079|nr:hypothetical protein [Hymenobacter qilianensis]
MNRLLHFVARPLLIGALLLGGPAAFSQNQVSSEQKLVPEAALQYLKKNKQALKLTDEDIADVKLSSESVSPKTGIRHVYLQQLYEGIEIHNAIASMSLGKDEKIVNLASSFAKGVGGRLKAAKSKMTATAAVNAAARHLNLKVSQSLSVLQKGSGKNEAVLFSSGAFRWSRFRLSWCISPWRMVACGWLGKCPSTSWMRRTGGTCG